MCRIIVIFAVSFFSHFAYAQIGEIRSQDEYLEFLKSVTPKTDVWNLNPLNKEWSKFSFSEIKGDKKINLINLFKDGRFSEKGGEYYWLEIPPSKRDQLVEGLIVFESNGEVHGFRYMATLTHKNGLGFIKTTKFNPATKTIEWTSANFMRGIILDSDIRVVLEAPESAATETGPHNEKTR